MRHNLLHFALLETRGKFSKMLLEDRLLLEMQVLLVEPHSKLFHFIDLKMQQLFEGGIINKFNNWHEITFNNNRFPEFKDPFEVLTFDELEAGFVTCFAPLLFGVAVFCSEWLVVLKYYLVVKSIFEVLFKMQRNQLNEHSRNLDLKIATWSKIAKDRQNQASPGASTVVK